MLTRNYEPEPIFINPLECSRRTGIAVQTLANERHLGRGFPYTKRGMSVLYWWPDVYATLADAKIEPGEG